MLESMLGPEVMKKIMAKSAALISVILGWIGLIMVMMTAFVGMQVDKLDANGVYVETVTRVGIHHAALWPMLIGFFCVAAALVVGGKKTKINLSYVLFLVSLWVMVNAIMQIAPGPSLAGMGLAEGVAPLMVGVSAIGGFLGILGGVVGIMGAGKYAS
ncbi:MAG: hypothetical protein WC455_03775 [Dehalococcoidia bacterium]